MIPDADSPDTPAAPPAPDAAALGAPLELLLFDQSFMFLGVLDTDGTLRRANRTALTFAGIAREDDVVGRPFWDTPWWRHDAALQERLRHAIATTALGEASRLPVSHLDAAGERHHVDFSLKPLRDPHGAIIGILAEGRDLTAQVSAVAAQREVEGRFQALFTDMVEGVAIHRVLRGAHGPTDYLLLDVNPAYERILGLSRDAVVGRLASEVYGDPPPFLEPYARVAATGRAEHLEPYFAPLDKHFSISVSPLGHDRFATIFTDVTEQKRVARALHLSEARLRANLENTPNLAVQWYDLAGRIQYWNPASEALYGWRSDEVLGKTRDQCIATPTAAAEFARVLEDIAATLAPHGPREASFRRRDGREGWILSTVFAMPAADDALGFVSMDVDITARKRAEDEREKLATQLVESQKLEAIGRLAGGVAHDFNNLLGVILGQTDLLLEHPAINESLRAGLLMVHEAAERSADLTRQLLAFARKQTVAPRALDLNATITRTLEMIRRLIGEDLELTWSPGANLHPVHIDPSQVDQLLANLCVNARDALRGHGTITIATANATLAADARTTHLDGAPGDYVMLAVRDDGVGIAPEVVGRIFEPFFTTKPVGQGSGLGLAMVYGIVRQNGGAIHVTSEPGHGTTLTLYLPRWNEAPAPPPPPVAAVPPPQRRETVLLVEDEPALRRLAQAMLERLGLAVLSAGHPLAALALCRSYLGEIDLLVTDVIMPEMNGRALFDHLHVLRPQLRCLFISGYTADVIAHHGVLNDGVHFLQKPFTLTTLAAKVREVLEPDP